MTIDQVAGGAATTTSVSKANQALSQTEFLQLFVTQLRNQDPLSPLEPDQLTAQLAQFSSLEQLTQVNDGLKGLATSSQQSAAAALLGLMGKEITFDGGEVAVNAGSAPAATYTLDAGAEKVTATVRDADGTAVRTVDLGAQTAGEHTFQFDGRTGTGSVVPDGTYTIEIQRSKADGSAATPVTLVTRGTVDGVDLAGDPPSVLVGGRSVPLAQVREVRQPAPGA